MRDYSRIFSKINFQQLYPAPRRGSCWPLHRRQEHPWCRSSLVQNWQLQSAETLSQKSPCHRRSQESRLSASVHFRCRRCRNPPRELPFPHRTRKHLIRIFGKSKYFFYFQTYSWTTTITPPTTQPEPIHTIGRAIFLVWHISLTHIKSDLVQSA